MFLFALWGWTGEWNWHYHLGHLLRSDGHDFVKRKDCLPVFMAVVILTDSLRHLEEPGVTAAPQFCQWCGYLIRPDVSCNLSFSDTCCSCETTGLHIEHLISSGLGTLPNPSVGAGKIWAVKCLNCLPCLLPLWLVAMVINGSQETGWKVFDFYWDIQNLYLSSYGEVHSLSGSLFIIAGLINVCQEEAADNLQKGVKERMIQHQENLLKK